jgi:hypothetical protein
MASLFAWVRCFSDHNGIYMTAGAGLLFFSSAFLHLGCFRLHFPRFSFRIWIDLAWGGTGVCYFTTTGFLESTLVSTDRIILKTNKNTLRLVIRLFSGILIGLFGCQKVLSYFVYSFWGPCEMVGIWRSFFGGSVSWTLFISRCSCLSAMSPWISMAIICYYPLIFSGKRGVRVAHWNWMTVTFSIFTLFFYTMGKGRIKGRKSLSS